MTFERTDFKHLARCLTAWLLLGCFACERPAPEQHSSPSASPSLSASGDPRTTRPSQSAAAGSASQNLLSLPPPTRACKNHCQSEDPVVYQLTRVCGGVSRPMVDEYNTPTCAGLRSQLSQLLPKTPDGCDCRPDDGLATAPRDVQACRERCAEVLPAYANMSRLCAGTPGSANHGHPDCPASAQQLYQRMSQRELRFCNCDFLDNQLLLEQAGSP